MNVDRLSTPTRRSLKELYRARGIVPAAQGFACPHLRVCRIRKDGSKVPLNTGNWAYVGHEYGRALIQGRPAKILFVAMDRGGRARAHLETFAKT